MFCEQGKFFYAVPVSGSLIPAAKVQAAKEVGYPLKEGEIPELRIDLPELLTAPVEPGACVGRASWYLNGEIIAEADLVCIKGVGRDICPTQTLKERLMHIFTD